MLGIDFGTTTTEVAVYWYGRPKLVADPNGDVVVPSAVAFQPGGRVTVGRKAEARRVIDPKNTLHSFKRIIGLPWFDQTVAEMRQTTGYDLEQGDDGLPRYLTRAGKHTARDLAEQVFRNILAYPDLPPVLGRAVVTAPSSFEASQREAIVDAARAAGLSQVTLIDEAYAAILPHLEKEDPERLVTVYDIGGGTFDVAVLRVKGLDFEVLATGGDPYLGGDDLDQALAEWATGKILEQFQWDVRTSPEVVHNLRSLCREAKVRLSALPQARINLGLADPVLGGKHLDLDETVLQGPLGDLLQRTFAVCDDVLHQAGLVAQQVEEVVLVGGTTRLPYVHAGVRQYFGREPVVSKEADCLVALGACIHASLQASHQVA